MLFVLLCGLYLAPMLTREKIVQLLQTERGHLAAEFGVSKIGLFGSYAKDRAGDASDIDLLMRANQPAISRLILASAVLLSSP